MVRSITGLILVIAVVLIAASCVAPAPELKQPVDAQGTSYHVDCSAAAKGDGTLLHPWNSVLQVHAHRAFAPGDSILLRRGTRCVGTLAPAGSGVNGRPITLTAYGTGARPVVDGNGSADQTGAVELTNVHDWIVQGIAVTNAAAQQSTTMRAGILVRNDGVGVLRRIIIRDDFVFGVTSSPGSSSADPHAFGGIVFIVPAEVAARTSSFAEVSIADNVVQAVGRSGIVVWNDNYQRAMSTDISVSENTVRKAEGDSILLLGVDHGVIERNVSEDGGHLPVCGGCAFTAYNTASAGIWPTRSKDVWIIGNEVFGEGAAGGDGEGIDVDEQTSRTVVAFNYSHDNDGGGILLCGAADAEVRFNVFRSNGQGEIGFSCPFQGSGIRIYNNVIDIAAGSSAAVVRTVQGSGTATLLFANNIVSNLGTGGYLWPAPVRAMSNLYVGNPTMSSPDELGSTVGPSPFTAPVPDVEGFAALLGYQTSSDAAASGSGISIGAGGAVDLFGAALAARPPIGVGVEGAAVGGPSPPEPRANGVRGGTRLTWGSSPDVVYDVARRTACSKGFEIVARSLNRAEFTDQDVSCRTTSAPRYEVRACALYGSSAWSRAVASDGAQ